MAKNDQPEYKFNVKRRTNYYTTHHTANLSLASILDPPPPTLSLTCEELRALILLLLESFTVVQPPLHAVCTLY